MVAYSKNGLAPLNGLALCAGVGGLELGLHIAEPGYQTVCYVEREAFAASTLVARMEDQALDQAPVWSDLKTFNGRPWCGCVDILTAGYPCQPFSTSGKRRADQDPRHLWPEVARIIRETQPDQVFLENVAGHLDLGFDQVARDLEEMGFDVEADLFTALEVGASHRRERLFILADTNRQHSGELSVNGACRGTSLPAPQFQRTSDWDRQPKQGLDTLVGSADGFRLDAEQLPLFAPGPDAFEAWHGILESRPDLKPAVSRNVDGMEDRVDRSAAAGNGVSSLVAAYAYRTLKARLCG